MNKYTVGFNIKSKDIGVVRLVGLESSSIITAENMDSATKKAVCKLDYLKLDYNNLKLTNRDKTTLFQKIYKSEVEGYASFENDGFVYLDEDDRIYVEFGDDCAILHYYDGIYADSELFEGVDMIEVDNKPFEKLIKRIEEEVNVLKEYDKKNK